jgi:cation:H+ antiporter
MTTPLGVRLCRYGDVIAERTGLGGVWVGLVFLATVAFLPELVTGMSAISAAGAADIAAVGIGAPNMAVSNILGRNLFKLLLISIYLANSYLLYLYQ